MRGRCEGMEEAQSRLGFSSKGSGRKEATASVERGSQPRRRAEGDLSRARAAEAFSPTRRQEGDPSLALRHYPGSAPSAPPPGLASGAPRDACPGALRPPPDSSAGRAGFEA